MIKGHVGLLSTSLLVDPPSGVEICQKWRNGGNMGRIMRFLGLIGVARCRSFG